MFYEWKCLKFSRLAFFLLILVFKVSPSFSKTKARGKTPIPIPISYYSHKNSYFPGIKPLNVRASHSLSYAHNLLKNKPNKLRRPQKFEHFAVEMPIFTKEKRKTFDSRIPIINLENIGYGGRVNNNQFPLLSTKRSDNNDFGLEPNEIDFLFRRKNEILQFYNDFGLRSYRSNFPRASNSISKSGDLELYQHPWLGATHHSKMKKHHVLLNEITSHNFKNTTPIYGEQYTPLAPNVLPSGVGVDLISPNNVKSRDPNYFLSRLRSFSDWLPSAFNLWERNDNNLKKKSYVHSSPYNLFQRNNKKHLRSKYNMLPSSDDGRVPFIEKTIPVYKNQLHLAPKRNSVNTINQKRRSNKKFPNEEEIRSYNSKFNTTLSTGRGRCDLRNGQAFHGDKCSLLLTQGSCLDHHWLVLLESGLAVCAHRKCPLGNLFYRGRCVKPSDHHICGKGQILYIDLFGNAECDCDTDRNYDYLSGDCFAQREKGFCPASHHIEIAGDGSPNCSANLCYDERLIKIGQRCYKKVFSGFCSEKQIVFHEDHGIAECEYVPPKSIFGVSIESVCPHGSRRRYLNKCHSVFRVPTQKTFPKQRNICPPSFEDSGNICRRTIDLFA